MKKVDCEFHYYHPELIRYLTGQHTAPRYYPETKVLELREGAASKFSTITNTYPLIDELMDFGERRVAEMDKCGVDVAVMGVSPAHEELPKAESIRFAKASNDAVAKLMCKYPGRFVGAAALPTMYVDEAIAELERCVKVLGFKYWHTHSNYRNSHLYEEKYLPLLAKCEELGCAFYMHPHSSDDADMKDMGYVYAAPGLGFGLDTMRTSLRLILNGTFDRFPKLRMILGHMGEYYPYILDRIDNRFAWIHDDEVKMKERVSCYFKNRNVIMTTSGMTSKDAFLLAKKVIGIDGIIFGSDYPYENLKVMTDTWNEISAELTEEEREKFWHGNAERYGLV